MATLPWEQPGETPVFNPDRRLKHSIICSGGASMRFDGEMLKAFKAEELDLQMKYYGIERAKYGIWAGNQGIYVQHVDELNDWDGRWMEDQYELYRQRQAAKQG